MALESLEVFVMFINELVSLKSEIPEIEFKQETLLYSKNDKPDLNSFIYIGGPLSSQKFLRVVMSLVLEDLYFNVKVVFKSECVVKISFSLVTTTDNKDIMEIVCSFIETDTLPEHKIIRESSDDIYEMTSRLKTEKFIKDITKQLTLSFQYALKLQKLCTCINAHKLVDEIFDVPSVPERDIVKMMDTFLKSIFIYGDGVRIQK